MVGKMWPRLSLVAVAVLFALSSFPRLAQADFPYRVQPGDSLSGIAERFSTSTVALTAANNLVDPDRIAVGEILTIPGDAPPDLEVLSEWAEADSAVSAPAAPPPRLTTKPARSADSVLGNRRILSFYGHPNDARMGILGELSQDELVEALKERAAMYQAVSDRPVQPAFEYIATVAQESAGADGKYRAHSSMKQVQEYADLAAQNGFLLILDIQVGHSKIQQELNPWIPLLVEPHVHLALDPEFDMWPGQLPGEHIGHTVPDDINYTQKVLSEIVQANNLPDKVLILHQFAPNMLPDKENIKDFPNVQVVTDMDGWGSQALKRKHYEMYVHDTLIEYAGIKLFFRQDAPLFTPEEVMNLDPAPDVIIYQ